MFWLFKRIGKFKPAVQLNVSGTFTHLARRDNIIKPFCAEGNFQWSIKWGNEVSMFTICVEAIWWQVTHKHSPQGSGVLKTKRGQIDEGDVC